MDTSPPLLSENVDAWLLRLENLTRQPKKACKLYLNAASGDIVYKPRASEVPQDYECCTYTPLQRTVDAHTFTVEQQIRLDGIFTKLKLALKQSRNREGLTSSQDLSKSPVARSVDSTAITLAEGESSHCESTSSDDSVDQKTIERLQAFKLDWTLNQDLFLMFLEYQPPEEIDGVTHQPPPSEELSCSDPADYVKHANQLLDRFKANPHHPKIRHNKRRMIAFLIAVKVGRDEKDVWLSDFLHVYSWARLSELGLTYKKLKRLERKFLAGIDWNVKFEV